MVTSEGMRSSSMIWRTKSRSGCDADGNPISISLNPVSRRVSNIFILRAGSIGSISAWLPSRRSTLHHRGARVIRLDGHVRSSSGGGTNGRYLS